MDLSYNSLHGSLPPSWSSLFEIIQFNLAFNRLNGSVPAAFSNWSQVEGEEQLFAYCYHLPCLTITFIVLTAGSVCWVEGESAVWDCSLHAEAASA